MFTFALFWAMTFAMAFIQSCQRSDDDGCGNINYTPQESFNYTGMPVEITGTNASGEVFESATYTDQSLRYDSIGFEINYDLREISYREPKKGFIKSAYACSVLPPFDNLSSVSFYSDKDFTENHPTGTNLSDLIRVSIEYETQTQASNEYLELNGTRFVLMFNQAPSQMDIHQFTMEFIPEGNSNSSEKQTIQFSPVTIRP